MLHLVGCNLELYYHARTYEYQKPNSPFSGELRNVFFPQRANQGFCLYKIYPVACLHKLCSLLVQYTSPKLLRLTTL